MELSVTEPVEQVAQLAGFARLGEERLQDLRGERLQIMLSLEELAAVDDFRFQHRMPTRAAAVRELLKLGLSAKGIGGGANMKSSDYGVFRRGPDGHRETPDDV
jgi:hypothetical protein